MYIYGKSQAITFITPVFQQYHYPISYFLLLQEKKRQETKNKVHLVRWQFVIHHHDFYFVI